MAKKDAPFFSRLTANNTYAKICRQPHNSCWRQSRRQMDSPSAKKAFITKCWRCRRHRSLVITLYVLTRLPSGSSVCSLCDEGVSSHRQGPGGVRSWLHLPRRTNAQVGRVALILGKSRGRTTCAVHFFHHHAQKTPLWSAESVSNPLVPIEPVLVTLLSLNSTLVPPHKVAYTRQNGSCRRVHCHADSRTSKKTNSKMRSRFPLQ